MHLLLRCHERCDQERDATTAAEDSDNFLHGIRPLGGFVPDECAGLEFSKSARAGTERILPGNPLDSGFGNWDAPILSHSALHYKLFIYRILERARAGLAWSPTRRARSSRARLTGISDWVGSPRARARVRREPDGLGCRQL